MPESDLLLREALRRQDALQAYAYALVRDWQLAQDAVQEALVAVHQADPDEPVAHVGAWLRRLVHHKAVDLLRRRRRETAAGDVALEAAVERQFARWGGDDEGVERLARLRRALETCLTKLPGEARRLILGFYRDAAPCAELGRDGGRSANAVRLALSRTRRRLRECAERELARTGLAP